MFQDYLLKLDFEYFNLRLHQFYYIKIENHFEYLNYSIFSKSKLSFPKQITELMTNL